MLTNELLETVPGGVISLTIEAHMDKMGAAERIQNTLHFPYATFQSGEEDSTTELSYRF